MRLPIVINNNYIISRTVSKLSQIIPYYGQNFSYKGTSTTTNQSIQIWMLSATFLSQKVWWIFNNFYVMCPESYWIRSN